VQPTAAGDAKGTLMTVLTPSRETELDAFDLDLRVVPTQDAPDAQDAAASFTAPTQPTGIGVCDA
jgi:hypothetical protein